MGAFIKALVKIGLPVLFIIVFTVYSFRLLRPKQPPITHQVEVEYLTDKIDTIEVVCRYGKLKVSYEKFITPVNNCLHCWGEEYITCGVRRYRVLNTDNKPK